MPFFGKKNFTSEDRKERRTSMQDWVDRLEASGVEVPKDIREELDYYNNILVRNLADKNYKEERVLDPAFDNVVYDPVFDDLNKKRVGHAKDIIMKDWPAPEEDYWMSSFDDDSIDVIPPKVARKLRSKK